MPRRDPFKGYRFPKDVILRAVRWYCRDPLSYRDVRNLLAERGVTVDAATVSRWVQTFGPEIRKRAFDRHRSWRGLQRHGDETDLRVTGRWCYVWRAIDQCGQLVEYRLTARRIANAARAFMREASDTVRWYYPLSIVTDKAHSNAKIIGDWTARSGPEDADRQVTRKPLNTRIEGDHAVLKHRLAPMRGVQSLGTAKATLKGVETFRAIRNAHFAGCERGVANEIAFVRDLFSEAKQPASRSRALASPAPRPATQRTPRELGRSTQQTLFKSSHAFLAASHVSERRVGRRERELNGPMRSSTHFDADVAY